MKLAVLRPLTVFLAVSPMVFGGQDVSTFSFSKVDLEFLEQTRLLNQRLERDGMVYHDAQLEAYVTRVGNAMLPAGAAPENVKYEFHVVRDPMPNAFALAGGSIYVNTGLLSLLENEDQLASVLGHEITHVSDRHGYFENRSYRKKAAIATVAAYIAAVAPGGTSWGAAIRVAGNMVPVLMIASIEGYSRDLERQADIRSVEKLGETNYDAHEMAATFRLLERKDEVETTKIFYTDHPKLEDRIAYVSNLADSKSSPRPPEALLAERKRAYQQATEGIAREDIKLAILAHKPRTARARAAKLLAFDPDSADNQWAMGEAYRALGPWTATPADWELEKSGKKEVNGLKKKFTAEEEDQKLLEGETGQATWKNNQTLAEESYEKALAIDPNHSKAFLGLGQLYDKEGKASQSIEAYRKYLELQPDALDRGRILQRVENLQRTLGQ